MNNIFSKNINALAAKNPELAEKLRAYIPLEVPQLAQSVGGIIFNTAEDLFITLKIL